MTYKAHYRNPLTRDRLTIYKSAKNDRDSLRQLPRWLARSGGLYRRIGAPIQTNHGETTT